MRLTVILGLDHVEPKVQNDEARRLLADLSKQIHTESQQLKAGDSFILRDLTGKRIGVADVFAS